VSSDFAEKNIVTDHEFGMDDVVQTQQTAAA
jgi:hypothetical protein